MTVDMLNILLDSFIADYQSFRETVKEPPLEEVVKLVEYSEAELWYGRSARRAASSCAC